MDDIKRILFIEGLIRVVFGPAFINQALVETCILRWRTGATHVFKAGKAKLSVTIKKVVGMARVRVDITFEVGDLLNVNSVPELLAVAESVMSLREFVEVCKIARGHIV